MPATNRCHGSLAVHWYARLVSTDGLQPDTTLAGDGSDLLMLASAHQTTLFSSTAKAVHLESLDNIFDRQRDTQYHPCASPKLTDTPAIAPVEMLPLQAELGQIHVL